MPSNTHVLPITPGDLCDGLFSSFLCTDFTVLFHDHQIQCHSPVLVQFSLFFRTLFNTDLERPLEMDFSFLNVSFSFLSSFFSMLYGQEICLPLDSMYEFYYLSKYFQLDQLDSIFSIPWARFSAEPTASIYLIDKGNQHCDLEFLEFFINHHLNLSDFDDLPKEELLNYDYLSLLASNLMGSVQYEWFLRSFCLSLIESELEESLISSLFTKLKFQCVLYQCLNFCLKNY
ncbi:hypothetical protein GEMRC1_013931 [Eukaryota sp. GEM-RC1]